MKCSKCDSMRTRVIDSRVTEKGYTIRRRRVCESCSFRFTTYEYVFAKKIIINNKSVLVEKPFVLNMDDAVELKRLSIHHNAVSYTHLTLPTICSV